MSSPVTLDEIRQARIDTAPFVHRTPLIGSKTFSKAIGSPAVVDAIRVARLIRYWRQMIHLPLRLKVYRI